MARAKKLRTRRTAEQRTKQTDDGRGWLAESGSGPRLAGRLDVGNIGPRKKRMDCFFVHITVAKHAIEPLHGPWWLSSADR